MNATSSSANPKPPVSPVEAILRRDQWVTIGGIVLVTLLAWVYLFGLSAAMEEMPGSTAIGGPEEIMAPQLRPWRASDFGFMFVMWAVMMVAMMLPSASPMILLHVRIHRQQGDGGAGAGGAAAFAAGYLLAWTGFSAAATVLQWGLERLALLSPMMVSSSPLLGAGLLAAAGVYQLTPIKDVCLSHCRSPVSFLMEHWRPGIGGALAMGLHHGVYCIGCCWFLMGLLFVGGVMNLLWIAGLTALVLLEKVVPQGNLLARATGVLFMAMAGVLLLGAL